MFGRWSRVVPQLAPSTRVRFAEARDMQVSRGHPKPTQAGTNDARKNKMVRRKKWYDLPRNLGFILCPSSNGFLGLCAAEEFRLGGGVGRFDSGRYVKYPSYSSASPSHENCTFFLSRRSMTTAQPRFPLHFGLLPLSR